MTSKPLKHRRAETTTAARISNASGTYHIGAEIGRGGFAVVFQALNVETGDFVAVKRFPLSTVDEESLASIQGEVELMKKLHHDNIVQYVDTIRTDEFLYIALEFMENGSLSHVLRKFGAFTESLTAIYVTQVLRGLKYLHDQGVLHRDIKGANILTTKDGLVKLADFGVAMKLDSKADEQDVVGTPYWMAPEIIEMSTPTAACDIWSVGCTIVELLTGKPPYYDLAPMAALFRIVQDDHPPLPEGVSEALRDFLLQCFQKEPIMRKSAEELLRHPWLQKTGKQGNKAQPAPAAIAPAAVDVDLSGFDDDDDETDKDITIKASALPKPTQRSGPPRPTKSAARLVGGNSNRPQAHRRPAATKTTTKLPKAALEQDSDDDWDADFAIEPAKTKASATKPKKKHLSRPSMDDISAFLDDEDFAPTIPLPTAKPAASGAAAPRTSGNILSRFKEEGEEDEFKDFDLETSSFDDEFQDADNLRHRMQQNATNPDEIEEELFMDFDENDFAQSENKEVHLRAKEILSLMSSVTDGAEEESITLACKTLLELLDNFPEQKEHLVTHHGVLPIIEMLEVKSERVLPSILRVVNKVIVDNKRAQEQLSLVGAIPIMIHLIESADDVNDICREAAKFVQQLCLSSGLTLQMLIGAGGLRALVKLMSLASAMDTDAAREVSRIATDCILQVFHVQSSRTRDFCRLFAKLKLLQPLGAAFTPMFNISQRSDSAADWNETHRLAMIISQYSRADAVVTDSMSQQGIIRVVINALKDPKLSSNPPPHQRPPRHTRVMSQSWFQLVPFPPAYIELMETLLKFVKNISMEPSSLDHLAAADAIGTLIPIMNGPIGDRAKLHIMPCMFNLCRISKRRQEQAADAGLIPHLQRLINEDSHLKQFALPIICDMAHASNATRSILWTNNGVKFYLNLLQENYWQISALNSLSVWLYNDTVRVEGLLIQPSNLTQLVEFFRGASEGTLVNIHKPFFDIMFKSDKLSKALGGSGLFVESLISRLRSSDAVVLRSLLKMLRRLHNCHPNPRQLVLDFNLYQIVQAFAQEKDQVLIQGFAADLLREFQQTTLA